MVVMIFEKWTVLNTLCNYATTSQKNTAPYFLTENLLAVSEFYLYILRPTDGDIWQSQYSGRFTFTAFGSFYSSQQK